MIRKDILQAVKVFKNTTNKLSTMSTRTVLYFKPFNKRFIIPLFCHFLIFWLLTENHINCIIRHIAANDEKHRRSHEFKFPLLDWINKMTSDSLHRVENKGFQIKRQVQ